MVYSKGERFKIRFADDIVIAESEQNLEIILKKMERIMKSEYSMKVNKNKIKMITR